ncbi:hypothetical protein LY56_02210 [Roseinatronobacter thiooxidans]|uniref:Uncharacterized protein n=1 Tax=Roseinatronobacter thiooxidans TaxID=121821 RepID=A0A2W7QLR8_9RHOB|nr:hypothetical protein [Roseinatronobacter thiooxidans]PZX42219.1 hypothetical protein LY56_02210 [Roseinatronobacter thiooxidans]
MRDEVCSGISVLDLAGGTGEITHGTVARMATLAIIQARLVISELRETVLPALSPGRRAMIGRLVRRLEHEELFDQALLEDLEALGDHLYGRVEAGTQVFWEPVECHVRGGHHVVHREPEAAELARACEEVQLLHKLVFGARAAARALREADQLLGV